MNYGQNPYYHTSFKQGDDSSTTPILAKPIEKVQNAITKTADVFIKKSEEGEEKKSHKTAIWVGSSVLVVSGIAALLNPKFSGKFINKIKNWAQVRKANAEKNKGDKVKSKFNQWLSDASHKLIDIFQFTNSMNAAKDVGFKWICMGEKFKNVKNDSLRNVLQKCDQGMRFVMSKVHSSITNIFDSVSKRTVHANYNSVDKRMRTLDNIIAGYKDKLTLSEKAALETKMREIQSARSYFSNKNVDARLTRQEQIMSNLEHDFIGKWNEFRKGFKWFKAPGTLKEKYHHNINNIKNNMSYWAEDMLMPQRNKLEQEGMSAVDVIMGDGKNVRGKYNEILDILSPHLKQDEKAFLEKTIGKTNKGLRKANHSECVEYFDKKRDLMLGGAPTDIISGLVPVGLSGIAIGTADNKDDRLSRAITAGFPAVAGVGASFALTAMLFSGVQGLVYGGLVGAGLSLLGSTVDKAITKAKQKEVVSA